MNHIKKYKRVLILLGTACVIYVSFCYILPLVVPFVLALVLAKSLQPWTRKIHTATHINQKICSVVMVFVSLAALGSFVFYIGYLCTSQLVEFIRHLPGRLGALSHLCQGGCGSIDNLLALSKGTSYRWLESRMGDMDGKIVGILLPQITGSLPRIFMRIGEWGAGFVVFLMATLLLSFEQKNEVHYPALMPYVKRLKIAGFAYLKAQGLLLFFIAVISTITLLLLKNSYAVLLGILIAIVDAFPILGSGTILIPWAVFSWIQKDYVVAAVLLTLYVVTLVIREVLEPRMMGKEMGLKPLYVLVSVYVGMKLFGIGGIVLGPIGLTILKTVFEQASFSHTT
ncbi:MAG: AI-2E family transporter [Eubacterium sp.]